MFDIVYIILAFNNPEQIKRLVSSLDAEGVWFYIHVDKKIDQIPFELALENFSNLKFIHSSKRLEISWGDNKMVQAILNLMKLVEENHKNGYCVLLSNNDYPIKSNIFIREYFASKYGNSFMSVSALDSNNSIYKERLNTYKFEFSKKRKDIVVVPSVWNKEFYRISNFISIFKIIRSNQLKYIFKLFKKRKDPIDMKNYLGSSWWAIPIKVMREILTFCENNPAFIKYHEETFISDEIFFQSILMHLLEKKIIDTKLDGKITHTKFIGIDSSPLVLRESDKEEIFNLPDRFLFVRKLDMKIDSKIFDLIDTARA